MGSIPASAIFAATVGTGASGGNTLIYLSAAAALAAIGFARLLPGKTELANRESEPDSTTIGT